MERGPNKRRRLQFNEVGVGTKRYAILQLLLRTRGVTSLSCIKRGLIMNNQGLTGVIIGLENDFGYDVRIIKKTSGVFRKRRYTYRIVARYNMDGTLMHDYVSAE